MYEDMYHAPVRRLPPPKINFGPRAGMLRPINDVAMDRLGNAIRAVSILKNSGLTVIDIQVMRGVSPTILIQTCALCSKLEGVPVQWQSDDDGRYTLMEAKLRGVRIHWKVRGN